MPRAIRDTRLDTRTAREKLKPKRDPYWRAIDRGAHLGYRKGKTGGFWIARYRGPDRKYSFRSLGMADDAREADGATVLDFFEAQDRARQWFAERGRNDNGLGSDGPYTVADAMDDYLKWYKAHRKSLVDVTCRINAFILPTFGEIEAAKLTTRMIREWHQSLAAASARKRTAPGQEQQYREPPDDPESVRRRRASANKVLTILKAALNHAYRDEKILSDKAWRRVGPFHDVDAPRIRYLTGDECIRLVNACDPDFRRLVQAALLTGCRYGELTALSCEDFNPDTGSIHIRTSKTGKSRDVPLNEEGLEFFSRVTAGRAGDELAFLRGDGEPWGKSHQRRRFDAAAKAEKLKGVSFHILRHCYGSALAQQGVSMRVIAEVLRHADTRITEKHYSHLAPSYLAETIRRKLPALGIVEESNVATMKRRAG